LGEGSAYAKATADRRVREKWCGSRFIDGSCASLHSLRFTALSDPAEQTGVILQNPGYARMLRTERFLGHLERSVEAAA
jgi:hypothetical protein